MRRKYNIEEMLRFVYGYDNVPENLVIDLIRDSEVGKDIFDIKQEKKHFTNFEEHLKHYKDNETAIRNNIILDRVFNNIVKENSHLNYAITLYEVSVSHQLEKEIHTINKNIDSLESLINDHALASQVQLQKQQSYLSSDTHKKDIKITLKASEALENLIDFLYKILEKDLYSEIILESKNQSFQMRGLSIENSISFADYLNNNKISNIQFVNRDTLV